MLDVQKLRQDFPLLRDYREAYLDNAATSQRPQCVLDAITDFYCHSNANPMRGFYPLSLAATDAYEKARARVARFIGAGDPNEVIFTRNASESLNLVAYTYGLANLKPGDEVAVSILEHHSNMLPWQMVCQKTGATLRYLDCEPDGSFSAETLDQGINERTKLVAVTHVSNVLGCVSPVRDIVERAHRVGAVVVLDGAQSVPHMPVNVTELDVDFLAFSGHKLMGPMGIGVLWGKMTHLEKMPPFLTGGEMIESVTREGAVYAEVPHKFEAGTVNAAGAVGLAAAMDYIDSIGFADMMAQEEKLVTRVMAGIAEIPGVHVLGDTNPKNHTGIVNFIVDGVHPHDVAEILEADGVNVRSGHHCAQPLLAHLGCRASTRASFMFYNTEEEADRLVESLKNVRGRMGL